MVDKAAHIAPLSMPIICLQPSVLPFKMLDLCSAHLGTSMQFRQIRLFASSCILVGRLSSPSLLTSHFMVRCALCLIAFTGHTSLTVLPCDLHQVSTRRLGGLLFNLRHVCIEKSRGLLCGPRRALEPRWFCAVPREGMFLAWRNIDCAEVSTRRPTLSLALR